MNLSLKKVVIIGAGFAGLEAAKILAKDERVHLTVVDRNNYHLFQPLLYQVATAGLSPAEIAMPVRAILRNRPNTHVVMSTVCAINCETKSIDLENGQHLPFDYLILAAGLTNSYFGNDNWAQFAPGLKTLEDAIDIRKRILTAFELAEQTDDPVLRDSYLTFVIVGGGPTGLELAGAIAEISKFAIAKDFVKIHPELAKIYLVEAGGSLLPTFHQDIWTISKNAIEKLGVEVLLNTRVTNIDENGVELGDQRIVAKTILWAAGVKPSCLTAQLPTELDNSGRVKVTSDLSISGAKDIFALGDIAAVHWKADRLVPGMAPGAMQQGRHAANNILRDLNGQQRKKFIFKDKGSLATIGRASAVCDLGPIHIGGFIAWIIWIFVHIFYLIGFHNRTIVLMRWAWSYFTFQKGTRLITHNRQSH